MSIFKILNNLWLLINKKRKIQILSLTTVMVFSGFSEMLILISAIPYLTAITQPNEAWNNPLIQKLVSLIEINSNAASALSLAA